MPVITVKLEQVDHATTQTEIRGHKILIDRPLAKNGNDAGPMGGELLLASLGGCFNSNLLAAIKARDLPISDVTIEIQGNLVEHPQHYDAIDMVVRSSYADSAEFEKLVTIAERSCIVANTLRNAVNLTIRAEQRSSV
jgi:putative redox protein